MAQASWRLGVKYALVSAQTEAWVSRLPVGVVHAPLGEGALLPK